MSLVSVVMPVFNAEEFLSEAINSILLQSFEDFEFIIIDDWSTDSTQSIVEWFTDSRIRFFQNEENIWVARTLNKGIKLSKWKYIARMDADDISFSNRLKRQVYLIEHSDYSIIWSWISIIDSKWIVSGTRKYSREFYPSIGFESPVAHPSVMYKKSIMLELSWYDVNIKYAEDYDLWIRAKQAGFLWVNIQETLLYYRMSFSQTKFSHLKEQLKATILLKSKMRSNPEFSRTFGMEVRLHIERLLFYLPSNIVYKLFLWFKL